MPGSVHVYNQHRYMNLGLTDKRIIITGGASGIGAAICEALHKEGAVPLIIDKNQGKYYTLQADLSDANACHEAIKTIAITQGRIDGIVNNAGLNDGVSLEHGDYAMFIRSIERNVTHYYMLVQEAFAHLKQSKGAIVNIISKVAFTGQGNTSGYAAANGMRLGLAQSWAQDFEKEGVRVNGVVVAECFTPGYADWIAKQENAGEKLKTIQANIPLENRMTTSREIADTVLYLLSPMAGTGQILHVDGGYVHLDRQI